MIDDRTPAQCIGPKGLSRRALLAGSATSIGIASIAFLRSSPSWGSSQLTVRPQTLVTSETEVLNLRELGADTTGVEDCTRTFQNAVNRGNVVFPPGAYRMSWSAMRADVRIPANRKIVVEDGAVITMTGGRFTAENVHNVEWQIDGWVKSVAMRTASTKLAWSTSPHERGFLEFAGDFDINGSVSGFKVHGSGKVSGDWAYTGGGTGLPNFSDPAAQINRKGIASWNARDVLVDGLDVFGFDGEAIYGFFFSTTCANIVFQNNYVHDTRFNALNFNAGLNGGGCRIVNNQVRNAFAVEASVGEVSGNHIDSMIYCGIWTGAGAGTGPIVFVGNTISNSGLHGMAATFGSGTPVTDVTIADNIISASQQYSVYVDNVNNLIIEGNKCIGSGTGAGAYDIGINHTRRARVARNTFMKPGPKAQASRIAVDRATTSEVWVDPESNIYLPNSSAS